MLKLAPGPASRKLAESVAHFTQKHLLRLEHKLFPDGESYIRFEGSVEGEDVVVFQGLHPPQDKHLTELLLMADLLKDMGASKVTAVIPYMAYARQDRRFRDGEAVSILTVLKMLKAAGVDEALTVNIHSPWVLENAPLKVVNLDATGLLAVSLTGLVGGRTLVLSPGKKGLEMASATASILDAEYGVIESRRDTVTGEVAVELGLDPSGRDVVLVDDVVSTGGTMAKCVELVKRRGAEKVLVACVHGLFIGDAAEKIQRAGASMMVATDTIPNPYVFASVAGLISSHLT